jgi:tetraacyldisaccharide 4'-kinase
MISDNHGTVVDDAAQTGDEPLLLAKSLIGVPVYVGKDRRKTGRCAITKFAPSCIILDDGMQYWQLYRNLDIVLVDAAMPFESGECLPAGFLREPPKALRRAGIVVVTRSDAIGQNECVLVANKINALAPNAKIFFARHVIAAFEPLHCADNRSKVSEIKRRAYMFCGIARPESFFDSALPLVSAEVVGRSAFPDHVEYSSDVLEQLEADIRRSRAEVVLTTQKDAMKLKDWNIAWPIYASVMNMMIDNDTDLLTDIVSKALCNEAGVRK